MSTNALMLERITYRGWDNAYRISNSIVELVVLADVGPRIVSYRFIAGENVFHEIAEQGGLTGGGDFRLYGGHRLWISPEVERTFSLTTLRSQFPRALD